MSDLFNQADATVREWTDVLARIRFGTVKVAGKNITGARIKAVAGRLANYADSNGSRVRPGLPRLAVDLEADYGSVKRAVQLLHHLGLLRLVRAGARPGHADEYQLAIPESLLESVELWSPSRHRLEVERVSEANRGRYKRRPVPPNPANLLVPQAPAEPVNNSGLLVPEAPADDPDDDRPAGATGTDIPRPAGATGTDLLVPQAPATDHRPRHNPDLPTTGDQGGKAAAPRANRPQPDSDAMPERCDHGLASRRRPDGTPSCALCRRSEATSTALAPVIPIRSAS